MPWEKVLLVLGVSAAPLSELRGGLPLALSLGFSPGASLALSLAGNFLPLPFLLWGLPRVLPWLERVPGFRAYWAWRRCRAQGIARYGPWFLVAFVALPLPGTGLWTGAALAALLGIPPRKSAGPLMIGVLLAGILVLLASLGFIRLFGL